MKNTTLFTLLILVFTACTAPKTVEQPPKKIDPIYLSDFDTMWVDSVFNSLNFEEKIGQLFMPPIYSNKGQGHIDEQIELVKEYKLGGFIWMQGNPRNQITYYNQLQAVSKVPLMFSIDAERGLAMRLDSTHQFPYQMTMGALQSDSLVYQMGKACAKHCRLVGAHINFAPVVDVNNNPKNPIINIRSFGAHRENVARKGVAYMKGLRDNGVLACAKHFPGHGDTENDSHVSLPIINHDSARLDSIELYPFKELIDSGVGSVMAAHLHIPTYDSTKNKASSLSNNVINGLLKKDNGYKGLVFTDALNMAGVAKYYAEGTVELEALKAGNDVLLFSSDIPKAISVIKEALKDSVIDSNYVAEKVYKILQLKSWLKIEDHLIYDNKVMDELFSYDALNVSESISENAIYWAKRDTTFHHPSVSVIECKSKYESRNFGINRALAASINEKAKSQDVLLIIYGTPYAADLFPNVKNILVSPVNNEAAKNAVKEILDGKRKAIGIKPI